MAPIHFTEHLSQKPPVIESIGTRTKTSPPALLGNVAWLWMHSDLHKTWPVWLLNYSVLPAIRRQTYVYAHCDDVPVAFACWTGLSWDAEKRYLINPTSLSEQDWDSGERVWVIDMVAPFGHASKIARHLRMIFRRNNTVVRALRVKDSTSSAKVIEFYSPDADKQTRELNRHRFTREFQNTRKTIISGSSY